MARIYEVKIEVHRAGEWADSIPARQVVRVSLRNKGALREFAQREIVFMAQESEWARKLLDHEWATVGEVRGEFYMLSRPLESHESREWTGGYNEWVKFSII